MLGRLAGWFNEVIVTDALRLLLDDPLSMHSFLDYVGHRAKADLRAVRTFERERGIGDGRVDLEGRDADGRPRWSHQTPRTPAAIAVSMTPTTSASAWHRVGGNGRNCVLVVGARRDTCLRALASGAA